MAPVVRSQPLIFIVDDDSDFQREVARALRRDGLETRSIDTLEQPTLRERTSSLVSLVAHLQPDVLLYDADMPGCDGRDALQSLKRDRRTAHIPVFLTSDRDLFWGRRQALDRGADEYLEKPLVLSGLSRRIRSHLEKLDSPASSDVRASSSSNKDVDREQAAVLRAEGERRSSSSAVRMSGAPLERRPVLIVEDDDDVRESLANLLDDDGIPTLTACNGEEALDLLQRGTRPALILLDLMMPVMDGWEFRRRLLSDASIPAIPLMVMSARPRERSHDFVAWLQKPLAADDVLRIVHALAG